MAGKQITGDGMPTSLAGMSKNQLYDIMSQMKILIEQNRVQARQILIQNPVLTRALFQAQIILGMVQPQKASPIISATASQNPQLSPASNQQSNIQPASSFQGPAGQNQSKLQQPSQTMLSNSHSQPIASNAQTQGISSHLLQPVHQPKGHLGTQPTPVSVPQSSQVPLAQLPQHIVSQPASLHQPPLPSLSTQSQPPMQNTGSQYMTSLQPPLQPPLPPQPRPSISGFPHQAHSQVGANLGFQHPSGQQLHHSQHMFHSGSKPPASIGPPFSQGQLPLPNQPVPPSIYQAGSSHMGIDFNQVGNSKQTDRGSSRTPPGLPDNTIGQLPSQSFPGQVGPASQPPRQPPLTPEMEKALLQQLMSLTPEQINMLPAEQRTQVLQLQQILRQ